MESSGFDPVALAMAVLSCAHSKSVGAFVSTSHAVEELRILSGDFTSTDESAANAISQVAVAMGCTVLFDEQSGADTLNLRESARSAT